MLKHLSIQGLSNLHQSTRKVNYKKKWNTSTKSYRLATSQHGPATLYITNLTANRIATMVIQTIQQPNKLTTTRTVNLTTNTFLLWYLTSMDWGERFKRTGNNLGIQVHFRGTNTMKTLLMALKDMENKLQKSGAIYRFKCPRINYPEEYTGESGRSFEDQVKEHIRAPFPIHQDSNSTGHPVSPQCFTTFDRESQGVTRNIKEAMYI